MSASTGVYCITDNPSQAERITNRIKTVGFSEKDISILVPDTTEMKRWVVHDQQTKSPEGATAGAGAGGIFGGAMGWLVGAGSLAVPGIGPFLAAGPILTALGGAIIGTAIGSFTGALIGIGIPEDHAHRFDGLLRDGHILIFVRAEDDEEVDSLKEIFKFEGALEIGSTSDASVKNTDLHEKLSSIPEAYPKVNPG